MLKLYYAQRTRSSRPRWTLEELGVPYEIVNVDTKAKENKRPDYLKINPMGVVPTLLDDGHPVYESAAICAYLADKFPEKALAPELKTYERGLYYQWLFFGMATLEPPTWAYYQHSVLLAEDRKRAEILDESRAKLTKAVGVVSEALGENQYLVGDRFTVADIVVGSVLNWGRAMKLIQDERLSAYIHRLVDRPAYKRANS